MDEVDKIKQRYAARDTDEKYKKYYANNAFTQNIVKERENIYRKILANNFADLYPVKFMEIGAGSGGNMPFFLNLGIKKENMFANELLDDRVQGLKKNQPGINIYPGNALDINFVEEFDIVFQSTVFTSVIDDNFRKQLADKMWAMLKKGGMVLWYDFVFSNPRNKDVKKVTREEVKHLFPKAKSITFYPVTLAPPISRRVGNLYKTINFLFPFLRTHIVAEIHK